MVNYPVSEKCDMVMSKKYLIIKKKIDYLNFRSVICMSVILSTLNKFFILIIISGIYNGQYYLQNVKGPKKSFILIP